MNEQFVWIGSGGDNDTCATPTQSVSELVLVAIEAYPDDSGLVEICGSFKVLVSPFGAESLAAQIVSEQPQTRTAKLLYLLNAGNPEWLEDFRRSLGSVIRDARIQSDSID